jgi:hypothetical protein
MGAHVGAAYFFIGLEVAGYVAGLGNKGGG